MFLIVTKPDRLREPKIMEGNKGLWVMQQWRAAVCSTVTQGSRAAGKLLLNQNRLAKIHCWLLTILTIAHTHKSNSTIANAIIVSKGEGQSSKVNTATSVCVCVCVGKNTEGLGISITLPSSMSSISSSCSRFEGSRLIHGRCSRTFNQATYSLLQRDITSFWALLCVVTWHSAETRMY